MADESSINSPYVYESLPAGEYTRIIELQPSEQESSPLRCKLRAISLKEEVEVYEALSYTWGKPVYSQTLIVDDTSVIKITDNLADALRKFRLGREVRRIWADAVSINQKDDVEKSQQILRMAYIYLGAHRVIVWLGDSPEEGKLIHRLHTLARQVTWAAMETAEAESDAETTEVESQSLTQNVPLEQATQAFEKIIQLPWFSRRWIIQEVVMNADVSLFCHNSSISWVRFISMLEIIAGSDRGVPSVINTFQKLFDIWIGFLRLEPAGDSALGQLLEAFETFDCTDGRDRIFALLNLHQGNYEIEADYTVDVQETYTNFVNEAIRGGRLAWLLTQAATRIKGFDGDWPSYVPDWRNAPIRRPFWDNHRTSFEIKRLENVKGLGIRAYFHCCRPSSQESSEDHEEGDGSQTVEEITTDLAINPNEEEDSQIVEETSIDQAIDSGGNTHPQTVEKVNMDPAIGSDGETNIQPAKEPTMDQAIDANGKSDSLTVDGATTDQAMESEDEKDSQAIKETTAVLAINYHGEDSSQLNEGSTTDLAVKSDGQKNSQIAEENMTDQAIHSHEEGDCQTNEETTTDEAMDSDEEHDSHTTEERTADQATAFSLVRVTWKNDVFPSWEDDIQGPTQVKAWINDVFRAIRTRSHEVWKSQSQSGRPKSQFRALYEFVRILLTGSNMKNVPKELSWIEPWWKSSMGLTDRSHIPSLIRALGTYITDYDKNSVESDDSEDDDSSDDFFDDDDSDDDDEVNDGVDNENIKAILKLFRIVLPARCVFTCAPDLKMGDMPQEVIGVGSSLLETGDEIISICDQYSAYSECSWHCVSERLFLVRDIKPSPEYSSSSPLDEEPPAQQFVGDCLLPSRTWTRGTTGPIQIPFFQKQATMRTLILS